MTAGDRTQTQWLTNATGFSAQGDRRLLFGLGLTEGPVEVSVQLPGETARIATFPTQTYHTIARQSDLVTAAHP